MQSEVSTLGLSEQAGALDDDCIIPDGFIWRLTCWCGGFMANVAAQPSQTGRRRDHFPLRHARHHTVNTQISGLVDGIRSMRYNLGSPFKSAMHSSVPEL